jgi:CHAT domain-containing protein
MNRFYENLIGTRPEQKGLAMSKTSALQEAKRWLQSYSGASGGHRFRHPSYWAGFVLIGDDGWERPSARPLTNP